MSRRLVDLGAMMTGIEAGGPGQESSERAVPVSSPGSPPRRRWRGPASTLVAGLVLAAVSGAGAFGLWVVMQSQGGSAATGSLEWAATFFGIGGEESSNDDVAVWMIVAFVVLVVVCAMSLMLASGGLLWLGFRGTRHAAKAELTTSSIQRSKELLAEGADGTADASRQVGAKARQLGGEGIRRSLPYVASAKDRVARWRSGRSSGPKGPDNSPPPF